MLSQLSPIFVDKYVIVGDYKALSETLRIELPSYCFLDITTNILVRNEFFRRGENFWQRSRNVVAPLAEVWFNFIDTLLNCRNTTAVASGLRTICINVEQQYAHNNFITASPTALTCSWRSTPTIVIQLTIPFDTECQFERYGMDSNYSSREHEWRRPQLKSVVRFHVEIGVGAQLYPMSSKTINALFCEHAVAGVAFLHYLCEQHVDLDAVIEQFRDVYNDCARRRARDILEFRVDLCRSAHASLSRAAAAAFCLLLRMSYTKIDTLARRLGLAGL